MTDGPLDGKPAVRPAPRKRRVMPWLAVILLFGVFVAGVVLAPRIMAALPLWITGGDARPVTPAPPPETTPPPGQAAHEDRQPRSPVAPVPDMTDFARQLAELQAQVARLQGEEDADSSTTEAVTSMGAQLAHLLNQLDEQQRRLDTLEETSPKALVTPMAVLAVARLRQSIDQGSSYAGALDGVRRLLGQDGLPAQSSAALAVLEAHASEGVASALVLNGEFASIAEDIMDADAVPENGGWWERAWARLTALVSVRPTGNVAGQDTPAIVARAEAALGRGDVSKAVSELEDLPARAAAAAEPWMKRAKARRDVMGAVDTLETALLDAAAPKLKGATS